MESQNWRDFQAEFTHQDGSQTEITRAVQLFPRRSESLCVETNIPADAIETPDWRAVVSAHLRSIADMIADPKQLPMPKAKRRGRAQYKD